MKHRNYALALSPLCALLASPAVHAQTAAAIGPTITVRPVAKGVQLTQEVTPVGATGGPLVVTIVRINTKEAGVGFEAALGQDRVWGTDPTFGREIVSTMVSRHKAVAGVNAGFFPFMGNPIGLHIQNGELVTEPQRSRSSFYLDKKGVPHIRAFGFAGEVRNTKTGEMLPLSGMNRKPAANGDTLLLFTPTFFDKTLRAPGRTETVISTGKTPLTASREFKATPAPVTLDGQTPLAPRTMVLSGSGVGADFLKRAADAKQALSIRATVTPLPNPAETAAPLVETSDIKEAVTGAVRLLTNGQITLRVAEEGMGQDFSTTRHPRTAVGITKSGDVVLVTVDGRQKELSRGASLMELANLLLKAGAVDAVNLDGGGSSACVVRGLVVNSPSEGKERPIADALLVRAKPLPKSKNTTTARMQTPREPLQTGETWNLANGALYPKGSDGIWGTRGGVGFVFQNGKYVAQRPGKGEVAFAPADGSPALSTPMTIVGAGIGDAADFMAKLTLTPDTENPLKATLTVRVANAEGDPLVSEPVSIAVSGGKADDATATTDRTGTARLNITWEAAGTRSITVSSPAKRFNTNTLRP